MLRSFQILGNSAGRPTASRNVTSVIVSSERHDMMFDCGENTYRNWKNAGYKWRRLRYIFLTHSHPDHIAGLGPFLFYRHLLRIPQKLIIYGPSNLKDFLASFCKHTGWQIDEAIDIRTIEPPSTFRISDGITVQTSLMEHKIPCTGYRLSPDQGSNLVFITDTRPSDNGIRLAQNADILIHEATFLSEDAKLAFEKFHTTTGQAIKLANVANVSFLFLTHFSPRIDDEELDTLTYHNQKVVAEGKVDIKELLESHS